MSDALPVRYVDTPGALHALCQELAQSDWFALDTEFLREKTYYPKLCLVQVATPALAACIDPLALPDLQPLLALLHDHRITKVLHAARQDLEIFYHIDGKVPAPVFDTQLAAPLLGYPDQTGYANLVRELTGRTLDKLHTRADWSQRPLTEDQLRYAADDVIYLVAVYRSLHSSLSENGRLAWLDDDFERLARPALYASDPSAAWLRVKGGNRLRGNRLAVLQALAEWRERRAAEIDRPRGWLLRDEALVDIARRQPSTSGELAGIRGLGERFLARSGTELLALIETARQRQPAPWPQHERKPVLSAEQDAVVDLMQAVVRVTASENALNPVALATRRQLEQLLLKPHDSTLLSGWHRRLVGERLMQLLRGDLHLTVQDGRLRL